MKRIFLVVLTIVLCSMLLFAEDLRFVREDVPNKHVVGPNGIYMMLSHYNRNINRDSVQGYESELQVFTPEFKEKIIIFPNALVGIFEVKGEKIAKIHVNPGTVPNIPSDGYLIVGHGRAAVGFMNEFVEGDKVSIRDYTPQILSSKEYKEIILMPNGTEVMINGWNRGRCADEVVAYNADYADRTYTNEWGFEFSVEKDEVYEIRPVANMDFMEIPKKGFVISAHGSLIATVSSVMEGDFIELE